MTNCDSLKAELTTAITDFNREVAAYDRTAHTLLARLGSRYLVSQSDEGKALAATHTALLEKRRALTSLRRRYRAAVKGQSEPRTKEAIIELFCDDGGSLVTAYDAQQWNATNPETDDDPLPLYEATTRFGCGATDAVIAASEQVAASKVLGWLWKHGYKSARWDTRCDDEESGRPNWASKDVYEWGDKA